MTSCDDNYLSVAVPTPLRQMFDYLPPDNKANLQPGMRVQVPFGPRKLVGIIEAIKQESDHPREKLRKVSAVPDRVPLIPEDIMQLCRWASSYYHYSLGETLLQALPKALRQGKPVTRETIALWSLAAPLDEAITQSLKRAHKQLKALQWLEKYPEGLSETELREVGFSKTILTQLQKKQRVVVREVERVDRYFTEHTNPLKQEPLTLNSEQAFALKGILASPSFHPVLLDGVTGSGKTEVYLQAIEATLKAGKQVLVLVPEIGLTPQTVRRFRSRFSVPVVCLHSGLSDGERLQGWLAASRSIAGVLIATRSGIFTPLPKLGLIIVDEEHDNSYKQQDTLRYNARDMAIYRAKIADCPVVLGSATPSLETLINARKGRYSHMEISSRAGHSRPPTLELLDIRQQLLHEGFAQSLITRMQTTLDKGEQVMVFLNRRGYAPSLICHDCGEVTDCPHCDAHLTLHRLPPHMHCHHCDYQTAIPWSCPKCHSKNLQPVGQGTERCEQILEQMFPNTPLIRVDRDSTRRKNALSEILDTIHTGKPCILLGTQMLAKGHHFPDVTLVAIVNADSGLFSSDFRGLEKTGQLILQVAGRAGREKKPGHVIIQTHNPQHPALQMLVSQPYSRFADSLMSERKQLKLPPEGYLALFRTESSMAGAGENLLKSLRNVLLNHHQESPARILGPIPAPMEKRQGRYRYQLFLQGDQRVSVHRLLDIAVKHLDSMKLPKNLRWTLDVDPQEMS
ncbi:MULTISPECIES: primosomal protein N' [unclassified Endozoicomonas]|uniref:primosomal protein N' n=2 Tax=Endozoicomonas TaxID=305899 RepID=UPI002148C4D7|nr:MULTISPECIES: primosomal protein N' [unclassified Endozoicomonas]